MENMAQELRVNVIDHAGGTLSKGVEEIGETASMKYSKVCTSHQYCYCDSCNR